MRRLHLRLGVAIAAMVAVGSAPIAWAETKDGDNLRLRDFRRPATTVKEWLAQVEAATVTVTGVTLDRTEAGLDITLETADGKPLQVDATKFRAEGNSLIADIPNAVLSLTEGQAFSADNPTAEIATVQVTQVDTTNIRVTVAGKNALPKQEVTLKTAGLAYSLNPEAETPEEELVVTGEGQRGYRVPDATTATKTDTPIRDIPQSIQVIPKQLLQDLQATRVGEALRNISGIQQPANFGNNFDIFYIRGFSSANEGVLRNGLRDRANTRGPNETINLERVEVLKGPSAALYGQGGLGGTINLVTKKPLSEPFYSVEATFGSFAFYRGAFDLSGPLNPEKTLLYRLTASAQTKESFVDFVNGQRYFISPVLTWLISKNTTITFEAEYLAGLQVDVWGLPAVGTVLPNPNGSIPRDRYVGEPNEQDNRYTFRMGYDFEHRFSDNWQVRNAFRVSYQWSAIDNATFFPSALLADNRTLQRSYSAALDDNPSAGHYAMDTYLVGKFRTGRIQHQLVTGFDLFREFLPGNNISRASSIDVFNPVYGRPLGRITSTTRNETTRDALGIYIQDQITLADNLKLLLGGRFDILTQELDDFLDASNNSFQQNEAFSPRVGIVYQPIPAISLYASYSRAVNQVAGTTFDNRIFEPERGTQYEVGVKADLNSRVSATLAFYNLTKANVLTADPRDTRFSIQTGEQRSRGIELDVAGEILPGWKIILAYAYTDAEITKDNRFAVGNQLDNAPKHSASLWTTYEIQSGDYQGLGVGLGFYYVGEKQGDLANSFSLPDSFRTDAAIFYKRGGFRVALNIRNLFDVSYFESAAGRVRVIPADPLTLQGTISYTF